MKNIAIILASGKGERTGFSTPKQFIKIAGKTIIEHTLDTFERVKEIDEIIVVSHADYVNTIQNMIVKNNYKKISKILAGGKDRRESSYIGINAITEENAKVLIHDAVRPFVSDTIIKNCLQKLDKYHAVDVATASPDTIIESDDNNIIKSIPLRKYFKKGQTPQAFDLKTIKKAHELANKDSDVCVTDDCGLILKYNLCDVFIVDGDDFNHKITYPIDVAVADKLFQLKSMNLSSSDKNKLKNKVMVIFGASKGIGKAVMQQAIEYGAVVYGFSRANGIDICDVSKIKKVLDDIARKEGKIDYIINTAAILRMGLLQYREIEDMYKEININYIGCINIAKLAHDYLKQTKGSLIFFTSSSYTRGRALYSVYSSTKAAIVNLAQSLSEEWSKDGIKVNVINPERTATPMRFENFGKEPENTLLSPELVAKCTLNTILSDYTGQIIDVKKIAKTEYNQNF